MIFPSAEYVGAKHEPDLAPHFLAADLFVQPGIGGVAERCHFLKQFKKAALENREFSRAASFESNSFPTLHTATHRWAVLTLLTFSVRVRYPLRDGSWSDRQDQRAIPVGAPCC
jgi:hypothetical protein